MNLTLYSRRIVNQALYSRRIVNQPLYSRRAVNQAFKAAPAASRADGDRHGSARRRRRRDLASGLLLVPLKTPLFVRDFGRLVLGCIEADVCK